MSVFNNIFTRNIIAIPSPSGLVPIPYPNAMVIGNSGTYTPSSLYDTNGKFIQRGVSIGDVVYNTANYSSSVIVNVVDDFTLLLATDIFLIPGQGYTVYQSAAASGLGNRGAILYNREASLVSITATSIAGDVFSYSIPSSEICPIQVKVLNNIDAGVTTDIYALW